MKDAFRPLSIANYQYYAKASSLLSWWLASSILLFRRLFVIRSPMCSSSPPSADTVLEYCVPLSSRSPCMQIPINFSMVMSAHLMTGRRGTIVGSSDAVLLIDAIGQHTSRDYTRVEDQFPGMAPSFMPPINKQHLKSCRGRGSKTRLRAVSDILSSSHLLCIISSIQEDRWIIAYGDRFQNILRKDQCIVRNIYILLETTWRNRNS